MRYSAIAVLLACLVPLYASAQVRPASAPAPDQHSAQPAAERPAPTATAQAGTEQPTPQRELSPAEYAAAFAAQVAGNTELLEGKSGKAYLDESYVDADGKLHIVISQAAAQQFRQEWPNTSVRLNIVNMGGATQSAKAKPASKSGGGPSLPGLSGTSLEVPGFGTLDISDPDFINKVKQIRQLNPEAFDAGFRQGFDQSKSKFDPATQAMMEQLVPMSGGLSVDEALDKIGGLMDIYNKVPKY
jgi:hypothetical protein